MSSQGDVAPREAPKAKQREYPQRGYPNRDAFAATADAQEPSAFFSALPLEIRQMIYVEFWRLTGLKQHVFSRVPIAGRLTHSPCITDPRAPDARHEKSQNSGGESSAVWERRFRTDWCVHWACEELDRPEVVPSNVAPTPRGPPWSPFLPAMQTCKRMYLECVESIYENLTFCFTEQSTLHLFLDLYGADTIRSIELGIEASPLLMEVYFHAPAGPSPAIASGGVITIDNNPWQKTCSMLSEQTRLRRLHVWFDLRDLRSWHSRVVETAFFDGLLGVRAANFVLMLPELHLNNRGQSVELQAYLLEGEKLEGAPFVVERGPRPNKWRVHLSRMNQHLSARRRSMDTAANLT